VGCLGWYTVDFRIYLRMGTSQPLLGNLFKCLATHTVQKLFSSVQMELHVFQSVSIAFFLSVGIPDKSDSFLFIPFHQVFIYIDKILPLPDGPISGTRLSASIWRVGEHVLWSMLM